MSILSADDTTQAEHYTKQTLVKTVADFNVIHIHEIARTSKELLARLPSFLGFGTESGSVKNPSHGWVVTLYSREGYICFKTSTIFT